MVFWMQIIDGIIIQILFAISRIFQNLWLEIFAFPGVAAVDIWDVQAFRIFPIKLWCHVKRLNFWPRLYWILFWLENQIVWRILFHNNFLANIRQIKVDIQICFLLRILLHLCVFIGIWRNQWAYIRHPIFLSQILSRVQICSRRFLSLSIQDWPALISWLIIQNDSVFCRILFLDHCFWLSLTLFVKTCFWHFFSLLIWRLLKFLL